MWKVLCISDSMGSSRLKSVTARQPEWRCISPSDIW
jgi:hypothetical protein